MMHFKATIEIADYFGFDADELKIKQVIADSLGTDADVTVLNISDVEIITDEQFNEALDNQEAFRKSIGLK